jgi:hypothetical protein
MFSEKYRRHVNMANPRWRVIRAVTFTFSFGRDCIFPVLPARNADHLHYKNLGHELPLIDLVPLHTSTHRVVTRLRARGHTRAVNRVLRFCYGLWVLLWLYAASLLAETLLGWRVVPDPFAVARSLHAIVAAWTYPS